MRTLILFFSIIVLFVLSSSFSFAQTYAGNERCVTCHSNAAIGGNQFPAWKNTLHARNLLPPSDSTIVPSSSFITGQTISMGSAFNNAQVILSKVGNDFFAQVGTGGRLIASSTYRAGDGNNDS